MTDFFNLICFPWNSLQLSGIFMYIAIGVVFATWILVLILSYSKKIRYLSYKCYFTYILAFRSVQKELKKARNEEQEGGWCCNYKYHKQRIEEFQFKTEQEQQEYRDYCASHPKELKPLLLIAFSVILPIAITLCLWLSGVGYRWYGYPLVQIDLNAIK